MGPYTKSLFIKSLKESDAVTAPTKNLLELCQKKGIEKKNCHLIGMPGIKISHFENPGSVDLIYEMLNIPRNRKIIFCPRALDEWYRIDKIIEAFNYVNQKDPLTFLLLLDYNSNHKYKSYIHRMIKNSSFEKEIKIFENMPTPYEHMNKLYTISSAVVSIPKSDGMPQSVFESFASGCPVISANHSTYDDIIIDKVSGIMVSGNDPLEIGEAILEILNNNKLRINIIKNAKRIVREKGDIYREMNKMDELYKQLVKQNY
jgi:glycosyltransferase involved in cell wall biosynthesis